MPERLGTTKIFVKKVACATGPLGTFVLDVTPPEGENEILHPWEIKERIKGSFITIIHKSAKSAKTVAVRKFCAETEGSAKRPRGTKRPLRGIKWPQLSCYFRSPLKIITIILSTASRKRSSRGRRRESVETGPRYCLFGSLNQVPKCKGAALKRHEKR